jgi:hypothetical protein
MITILVKAFRNLVSGEDAELSAAYAHFHKMIDQEEGMVRNATLAAVSKLQDESTVTLADVRETLFLTTRTDMNTQRLMTCTDSLHRQLDSKVLSPQMSSRKPFTNGIFS